tara:strand:+ start:413 stop:1195 length:783 start_codon:yes stop_codon:yes gene_type:complete
MNKIILTLLSLIWVFFTGAYNAFAQGKYDDMAFIKGGSFQRGSHERIEGAEDEKPVSTVSIDSFYMDKYEVTNRRYRKCVEAGVCTPPDYRKYFDLEKFKDHPVVYVTWFQANQYALWVSKRLPTEAEWEYAARGGLKGMLYPWGNGPPEGRANYKSSDTTRVGSFPPNEYGLYDMAGNIREWCMDWYGRHYYDEIPLKNPQGPLLGVYRVVRGASWYNNLSENLRVANRHERFPEESGSIIGFRCVVSKIDAQSSGDER